MQIIDTHAHIYLDEFSNDIASVIQRAKDTGIKKIMLPNIDKTTVIPMLKCCNKYPDICSPMLGLHPTSVKANWKEELDEIFNLFQGFIDNKNESLDFCGIGETGIDLYWDKSFEKQQIESFIEQLNLAVKLDIPIVIHSRNSIELVLDILSDYKNKIRGVLHCFPGNVEQAYKSIEMGMLIGVGGVVTYKNALIRKVVGALPPKSIVLETDAPYLAPVPFRGKRNESSYLKFIIDEIASIKNIKSEEVCENTFLNTCNMLKKYSL